MASDASSRAWLRWSTLLLLALPLAAVEPALRHPRSVGMGGASVATPSGREAQAVNPAGLARADEQRTFEIPLWAYAGARFDGELQQALDQLAGAQRLSELSLEAQLSAAEAEDVVRIVAGLAELGVDTLSANLGGGVEGAVRWDRWMLGAGLQVDSAGLIGDIDLRNLGLGAADALVQGLQLRADEIIGRLPADYQPQLLAPEQQAQLAAAGYGGDAIKAVDAVLDRAGSGSRAVMLAVDGLVAAAEAEPGSLDENNSRLRIRGLAVVDIPLSYGHPVTPWLDVGVTMHYYRGRVYGLDVSPFDVDDLDALVDANDPYRESDAFGIDLGLLARWSDFRFGLSARRLNTPTFDGLDQGVVSTGDIELEPQLVLGAAWLLSRFALLEVDLDLLRHEGIDEIERQALRIGLELSPLRWLRLRAGTAFDLVERPDELSDLIYTLGADVGTDRFRLEAALGIAPETVEYEGEDWPVALGASLGLAAGF